MTRASKPIVASARRHYHPPAQTRIGVTGWQVGMNVAAEIERKLAAALRPARLRVIDESALHQGHAGHRPEGQTHFRVEIVSAAFEGQSRVARQRRVYEVLSNELKSGVHALALATLTPAEDTGVAAGRGQGR